jgi:predicted nucleic acid-binding protein
LNVYADSSFFVSLYITDAHAAEVRRLLEALSRDRDGAETRLWLTPLHRAEWTHALEQHVYRRFLTRREAERIEDSFQIQLRSGLWQETPLPTEALEKCELLARKHVAVLGSRTLDTLHVASALLLGARCFWTFDERQRCLAQAERLKTN